MIENDPLLPARLKFGKLVYYEPSPTNHHLQLGSVPPFHYAEKM